MLFVLTSVNTVYTQEQYIYTLGHGRFTGDGADRRGDFIAQAIRRFQLRRATAPAPGYALTSRL